MFGRVVAGLKALFSLPSEQRWPAFKRAVKMGVTASAGSFLAFAEQLRSLDWSDLSPHTWHMFLTEHSDYLESVGKALAIAVVAAVLTALAEITSQQPRDARKQRKAERERVVEEDRVKAEYEALAETYGEPAE